MRPHTNNRTKDVIGRDRTDQYNSYRYYVPIRRYERSDGWVWRFINKRLRIAFSAIDLIPKTPLMWAFTSNPFDRVLYKLRCKTTTRFRYKEMPPTKLMRYRRGMR